MFCDQFYSVIQGNRLKFEMQSLMLHFSLIILLLVSGSHGERNDELILDERLETGQTKQLQHPIDYDYYVNAERMQENSDLSASAAMKIPYTERNRPVDVMPVKSLPWYGSYSVTKPMSSMPTYPSRSYDPYIRRYDRFDEQYHRTYPQYFEDMYLHRQRFDPYDSYSPRVPQYPEPYVMYPDRYLDTPAARDYLKTRRGYMDDTMGLPDSYNSKYGSTKLPDLMALPPRNERVVYYAHLPEIVRTPYDMTRPEERERNSAALTMSPNNNKSTKKKIKSIPRPLAHNATGYKMNL